MSTVSIYMQMKKPACFLGLLFSMISGQLGAQSLQVSVVDSDGNPLPDSVIELLLPAELQDQYQENGAWEVDQLDKEFVPGVTVVTRGSQVSFPNSDDILHHVYSFSEAKTFNIPLYGRGENNDYFETFQTTGVVEIGCNIHDWMLAYIYVAESKLAVLSDLTGNARLEGLPPGEFSVRVWHPRVAGEMEDLLHTVSIIQGGTSNLDVVLELRRDRRVRRAPGSSGRRYR